MLIFFSFISNSKMKYLLFLSLCVYLAFGICESEYRTFDGSCNNLVYSDYGKAGNYFLRLADEGMFADDISVPVDRGNARTISNTFATELLPGFPPRRAAPPKNEQSINMLEAIFAQFINHDLQHNLFIGGFTNETVFYTPIFPGDVMYKVNATNNYIITSLSLGEISPATGQFEIFNSATSWFDLSPIYGNDDATIGALRLWENGLLKTSTYSVSAGPQGVPPILFENFPPSQAITNLSIETPLAGPPNTLPTFGDERGNENLVLFLVHTAFYREHNRLATNLKVSHPEWNDEKLFQEARKYNIAVYQHIVFDSYIPLVLGLRAGAYEYNPNINPDTSLDFATGAFRYGHFTVGAWNLRNESGCLYEYTIPPGVLGPFAITSTMLPNAGQLGGGFTPQVAINLAGGIPNVMMGLFKEIGEKVDIYMSEDLRSITFGGSIGAGIDIFTFDIVRGRLNGLPDYYTLRSKFYPGDQNERNIYRNPGCQANHRVPEIDPIECFEIITGDHEIALKLQGLYSKINNIDAIVGLMAEAKDDDKFLPPTTANIILQEYLRKRNGDRFWYENGEFESNIINEIQARQMSDVIRDNLFDMNFYDNIFQTPPEPGSYPRCDA